MKEPVNQHLPTSTQVANLMAHPAAGMVALSALGVGLASQAMGNWLGAMVAAADASQRFWTPLMTGHPALFGEADAAPAGNGGSAPATAPELLKAADNVVPLRKVVQEPVATEPAPQPVAAVAPAAQAAGDDLKAIAGIGPKMEQVLNGLGVASYAQIAAWEPADVARIEEAIGFAGRIDRDGWVAQAAALVAGGKVATGRDA